VDYGRHVAVEHHRRKHARHQRLGAASFGLAFVMAVGWLILSTIRSAPPVPTDPSATQSELGVFADVRGWVTYGDVGEDYFGYGIWAVDPANPDERPVLLSRGAGLPIAWSRDGSKLLSNRGGPFFQRRDSLVVVTSDGAKTVVARAEEITGGSFTPDGSAVVYGVSDGKDVKWGIYIVDAKGGTPQLIYAPGRGPAPNPWKMAVYSPTLSPDGSRLAYVEGKGSSGHSLWVTDVDGTDRHRIVRDEVRIDVYSETNLQWSPDGTRLVFGGEGIYVVNDDGSALTRVARGRETAYWSPDGSRIAFQRFGTFYTMAPDGSDIRSFGVRPRATESVVGPWNPLVPAASASLLSSYDAVEEPGSWQSSPITWSKGRCPSRRGDTGRPAPLPREAISASNREPAAATFCEQA
jgi:hypothetical protein